MIGAVTLACIGTDQQLSDEILEETHAWLKMRARSRIRGVDSKFMRLAMIVRIKDEGPEATIYSRDTSIETGLDALFQSILDLVQSRTRARIVQLAARRAGRTDSPDDLGS
jgi:hypothetical protein